MAVYICILTTPSKIHTAISRTTDPMVDLFVLIQECIFHAEPKYGNENIIQTFLK